MCFSQPCLSQTRIFLNFIKSNNRRILGLCGQPFFPHNSEGINSLPRLPICTSVNLPRSPICTVVHPPIVHLYYSMKQLPLFLVRTVHICVINLPFRFFPYNLQVKIYSMLKIVQVSKMAPQFQCEPKIMWHTGGLYVANKEITPQKYLFPAFVCHCGKLSRPIQWNLIIKRSDITKLSYNKVIFLIPALYISVFLP